MIFRCLCPLISQQIFLFKALHLYFLARRHYSIFIKCLTTRTNAS